MNIKVLVAAAVIAGLAGCASTQSPLTGNESVLHIKAQDGDEVIARRLDKNAVENLQHFVFTGAEHTMELGIVKTGYQNSPRRCLATISYAHFEPGAHYTLSESSAVEGQAVVSLIDANGKTLVRETHISCL